MSSDRLERLNAALAGRYAIDREIGHGGMAVVYLADDLRHRRKVAVKFLRPEFASAAESERFVREIAVASRLNHPHIVALYDSGEADGLLFYVMPYIAGESLRQKLDREKQLPIDEALTIARQVAAAIDHAHARGLIHRDIKPENVLLYEGEAMVADFGIAWAADATSAERITAPGMALGTPEYMSPEQASAEPALDARSDIYSLACVLYELLAGEPPHTGATAQAVIVKQISVPAPAVRRLRPTVPPAVDRALARALAKVPADRFASCAEFIDAFSSPVHQSRSPSVAVLPFLNMSPDPANEFFADGITEDVIAQLSKIRGLKVISRTSVMPFKKREQSLREIAAILDAATLLEGSVRRDGDRVRIVAQLVEAATDRHLWAETYDRQLTDIFQIQTDVALSIAAALRTELSPDEQTRIRAEPTHNLHAYHFYLQGRHCLSRYSEDSIQQAIGYFEKAIEADPAYALPYVGIARGYGELFVAGQGGTLPPDVMIARAKEAIRNALRLDSDLGEAHGLLGLLKFTHDFDWAGAERELRVALELSPGSADIYDHFGWLCWSLERHDDALSFVKRAQELDPLSHRSDLANTFLRTGRYEEARREAEHVIVVDPTFPRGHSVLGWAYLKLGQSARGIAELEQASRLAPGDTLFLAQLGEGCGIAGQVDRAREILHQMEDLSRQRYVSPYHFAYVYTGLGELDQAMTYLERAYEERAGGLYAIKGSFLFEQLHPHPRFQALLRKMKLL